MTAPEAVEKSPPAGADHAGFALDKLRIDTIRTLSMDAVQEVNSGHPGTPMALAPVAYYLWHACARAGSKAGWSWTGEGDACLR